METNNLNTISKNMMLSIVVIVYNEAKTIKEAIDNVRLLKVKKEIIVIDNCSTDGTKQILNGLKYDDITVIYQKKNLGVGASYKLGIELSKGDYIYIHHADLEYDYRDSIKMMKFAIANELDAVFGSRLKVLLERSTKFNLIKERPANIASLITTYLINKWYGYEFTDIIGAELFKSSVIKQIKIDTMFSGFKFEHVSRMCKKKLKIGEINVNYKPRDNSSEKKIKSYNLINALYAMAKVRIYK